MMTGLNRTRSCARAPGWLGLCFMTALGALVLSCIADRSATTLCSSGLRCPPGLRCTADQDACISDSCGDGKRDRTAGEVCDDGNISDGDGCGGDCKRLENCGDGSPDEGEVCDDGNRESRDGCSEDCLSNEVCGNGYADYNEICDDGNRESHDGCRDDCQLLENCGNGRREPGEACDDGNQVSGDRCSATCISREECGNEIIDVGEQCDMGGLTADCNADCTAPVCGDKVFNQLAGEACDEGGDELSCDGDCTRPMCGDAYVNQKFVMSDGMNQWTEECDEGFIDASTDRVNDTATCDGDCTNVSCGDRHINAVAGEQCDNGTENRNMPNWWCRTNCLDRRCGDGIVDDRPYGPNNVGEQCDTGHIDNRDPPSDTVACDSDCTRVACGDNHVNAIAGEQCDNGDQNSDDPNALCRENCLSRRCGDGIVDDSAKGGIPEQCDSGDIDDHDQPSDTDDCDSDCTFVVCGDNYWNKEAEACDGSMGCQAGFVCSATCDACIAAMAM